MIPLSPKYQERRNQFKQYLAQNPQDTFDCVVWYYEHFLALEIKYEELQTGSTNNIYNSLPDLSFELPLGNEDLIIYQS